MSRLNYKEYQKLIGDRIKQYRVNAGISQKDLENESGVSVRSISRLEQGASVQLESLIKILTALNLDANLDLLIPDQTKRPSFYLEDSRKPKQRVRKKARSNDILNGEMRNNEYNSRSIEKNISLPLLTNFVNGAITELQLKNNYNKRNETPI